MGFQAARPPTYLSFDTLDDRRELAALLGHLHPAERWRFVRWCCTRCPPVNGRRPVVTFDARDRARVAAAVRGDAEADRTVTAAAWGQVVMLSAVWGLSLTDAASTLVAVARGRTTVTEVERQCGSRVSSATTS